MLPLDFTRDGSADCFWKMWILRKSQKFQQVPKSLLLRAQMAVREYISIGLFIGFVLQYFTICETEFITCFFAVYYISCWAQSIRWKRGTTCHLDTLLHLLEDNTHILYTTTVKIVSVEQVYLIFWSVGSGRSSPVTKLFDSK